MSDQPIIIWVNSPPFVERGPFTYLEEKWPGGVIYAVLGELRPERAMMGWGEGGSADAALFKFRSTHTISRFCREILHEYPGAVHLVAGLSSSTGRALSHIVKAAGPNRVAVYSERPGAYGRLRKRLVAHVIVPLKYAWLVRRFRSRVGLLLPLGQLGVRTFSRYGWPAERLAPFMYCPPQREEVTTPLQSRTEPIRFLYVGRMSRYTKGTDVLLKAASKLEGDWRLTLLGGHGDLVDSVRTWSASRRNVDFFGTATPDQVRAEILSHDICIVPSRFDGWNVVVNEALAAGRGVIATDQSVSHEMIIASRAGIVVRARSARKLATAMQTAVNDPSLAAHWSVRALDYAPRISQARVGRYLFDLLRGLQAGSATDPSVPPWLQAPGNAASTDRGSP